MLFDRQRQWRSERRLLKFAIVWALYNRAGTFIDSQSSSCLIDPQLTSHCGAYSQFGFSSDTEVALVP